MVHRLTFSFVLVTAVVLFWATSAAFAQGLGQQQQGGSGTAGIGGTVTTGFSLSDRFSSNFNRYTGGSQSAGATTAGAAAAESGMFGGQSSINTGGIGGGNMMRGMMGMGMMGGYGRNMMGGMNQQQGNTNTQNKIRTHIRLGFASPPVRPAVLNGRVSKVLTRVLQRRDQGGGQVSVAMEGNIAVLTGTVASDHSRDVMERLALLEPGIAAVRNELTVDLPAPTPESSPTSSSAGQRQ